MDNYTNNTNNNNDQGGHMNAIELARSIDEILEQQHEVKPDTLNEYKEWSVFMDGLQLTFMSMGISAELWWEAFDIAVDGVIPERDIEKERLEMHDYLENIEDIRFDDDIDTDQALVKYVESKENIG